MEWSFRLLMVFAAVFALLAADHHLLGGALTDTLGDAARVLIADG